MKSSDHRDLGRHPNDREGSRPQPTPSAPQADAASAPETRRSLKRPLEEKGALGKTEGVERLAPAVRWLPDAPESTTRSFDVWLVAGSEEAPSELTFQWRVTCEKHIPFCVKELFGCGKLRRQGSTGSSEWRTTVAVDLSRSGYGQVTLVVTLDGDERSRARATTVRAVCTDLPHGRSMTRVSPCTSTKLVGEVTCTQPVERWAGERRWQQFGSSNQGGDDKAQNGPLKPISQDELAAHRNVSDGWVAVRGLVFDVSEFLNHHPGGVRTLLGVLGIDATEQFDAVHPQVDAEAVMKIGGCIQGLLVLDPRASGTCPTRSD